VHVLDEQTVVLPDRPGNNRIDSLLNVLSDPRASMIFLVPGPRPHPARQRHGRGQHRPGGARAGAVRGRLPVTALVLTVREVLYQCPRALVRSKLWDPSVQVDPASLATLDEVLADQVPDLTLEESRRLGSTDDPLW
jgi:predicted pyridoxine 5'-phosphate oxidase superfamily flavin-nucleotide-binding protein